MAQEPQDYAYRFSEVTIVNPPDKPINIYNLQGYDDYLMADADRFVIRGDIGNTQGGSIYGSQILLQGIDTRELKYACIDTARIKDAAITNAKIESITWDKGQGGTLTLGGISNISGVLNIVDTTGSSFAGINNAGLYFGSGDNIFKASSNGIQLGHSSFASAPFRVDMQGNLTATSATITGSITSTSGSIAGWTIDTTSLSKNNAILDSSGTLTLGTSNDIVKLSSVNSTYRLWIGNATAGSAPFRVTKAGAVTMTNATITGYVASGGAAADINAYTTTISGGKITTGTMNWNRGYGGSLTLGGASNNNGQFSLRNSSNTEIVAMNNTGVTVKSGGNYYIENGGLLWFKEGGQVRLTTSSAFVSGSIANFAYSSPNPTQVSTFSTHQNPYQAAGPVFSSTAPGTWEFYLGNRHSANSRWERISLYSDYLWIRGEFQIGNQIDALRHSSYITSIVGSSGSFSVAHGGTTKPNYVYATCCGGPDAHKILVQFNFDGSDSTNVSLNWITVDGSYLSSSSRRFHITFIWY